MVKICSYCNKNTRSAVYWSLKSRLSSICKNCKAGNLGLGFRELRKNTKLRLERAKVKASLTPTRLDCVIYLFSWNNCFCIQKDGGTSCLHVTHLSNNVQELMKNQEPLAMDSWLYLFSVSNLNNVLFVCLASEWFRLWWKF